MKAYELLFFVDQRSTEEVRAGVMKRIDVAITTERSSRQRRDWGSVSLLLRSTVRGDYAPIINFHADQHDCRLTIESCESMMLSSVT